MISFCKLSDCDAARNSLTQRRCKVTALAVPKPSKDIVYLRNELLSFAKEIEHKFSPIVNERGDIDLEFMENVMDTLGKYHALIVNQAPSTKRTQILKRIDTIFNKNAAAISYYSDPDGLRDFYYRDVGLIAEQLKLL